MSTNRASNPLVPAAALLLTVALGGCEQPAQPDEQTTEPERAESGEAPEPKAETPRRVTAEFIGTDGASLGTAELTPRSRGVAIEATVSQLEPGRHAFHIHQRGVCEPPEFTSAGGHFNPFDAPHGPPEAGRDERHAGDMPNQLVSPDGSLQATVRNALVSLDEGEGGLRDADGSALVIHAGADDYETQPSGAAGARVACAVIHAPRERQASTQ